MKFNKIIALTIIIFFIFGSLAIPKPRVTLNKEPIKFGNMSPSAFVLQSIRLDANNIDSWFHSFGIFDQDMRTTNTPGFMWPKGSNKFACFTAGLSIGCKVLYPTGPRMAQVMASYKGEYRPGVVVNGAGVTSADFKIYSVKAGDNGITNPDYENWDKMIPYGAPYYDVNNNGVWDKGIDVPGRKNAAQTFFLCMTDAFVEGRDPGEGFGGGVSDPLLLCEIHMTAWAYNTPGLEDLQFLNWVIINKNDKPWQNVFMGLVVDPDLGDANDDYIGCDTLNKINLGYVYNGDNNDPTYGLAPPAMGMDFFKSPIIHTSTVPSSSDTLGLTSFVFFTNTGSSPPPCESDPNGEPIPAYNMLQGLKKNRTSFYAPPPTGQTTPTKTKFVYPGDPETQSGWTETVGSYTNCDSVNIGSLVSPNPTGDRRFIFNSGREDFTMPPGDTQNVVVAQFVARGTSNVNSVTKLKGVAKTAKIIYLADFNVTPPPVAPQVTASYLPTNNGQCKIYLSWDDKSENYKYWDTIFFAKSDSNIYTFQGYEIYEINKFASSLPDFTKPETINTDQIQLLDIFDIRDSIGTLIDTFSTGASVGNPPQEQYAPYPIVPPYKMSPPTGFPDKGIYRGIVLPSTRFVANYGNVSGFIYGQEYQFAVVAYAISKSTKIKKGFRVIRNSVGTVKIKIIPTMPPAGTIFSIKNGDTLNTSSRDLSLMPIVRSQELIKSATYRLVFNPMSDINDTSYNILRKLDGQNNWEVMKSKLKYSNSYYPVSQADDSSRVVDGLYFNFQKIRTRYSGSDPVIGSNFGIIRDPYYYRKPKLTDPKRLSRDSIQTRQYCYEYTPQSNQFLIGSQFKPGGNRWQSDTMSISFPSSGTFTNLKSGLTVDRLRKIKIVFNTTGQSAYYYNAVLNEGNIDSIAYRSMKQVPFQVFECDYTDSSTTDRQINVGYAEFPGYINNTFTMSADSLGGKLIIYFFNSNYSDTVSLYRTKNLFIEQSQFDIMYAWSPKLIAPGAWFTNNDVMYVYPYTITRPYVQGNIPLTYEFRTVAPVIGDPNVAKETGALSKIKVVPNPYYGFSTLDRTKSDRFVKFTNLPLNCKIKIYTLNGDLINTINKPNDGSLFSSTAEWNLLNQDRVPVASGIYIALIDAPGIGTKVIKIAVFTSQERLNF
jgi:hypothetical protein